MIDYNHPQVLSRQKTAQLSQLSPSEPAKLKVEIPKVDTTVEAKPTSVAPVTPSPSAVSTVQPQIPLISPKASTSKISPKKTAIKMSPKKKNLTAKSRKPSPKVSLKSVKISSPKPSTSAEPAKIVLPPTVTPANTTPAVTLPPPPPPVVPPVSALVTPKPKPIKNKPQKTYKKHHGRQPAGRKSHTHRTNTKELGRWKPLDDLTLLIGVQQTNDLKTVHRGTKFSCKFTLQEVQSRWNTLMYDESISRLAVAAMQNLHPELIEMVQAKALYSNQEEEMLGTIKSTENPTLDMFQELLDKYPHIFFISRTPKRLFNYWQLLKSFNLLPDQTVQPLNKPDQILSFSDAEEQINDSELNEYRDEELEVELRLSDRRAKQEIRTLENELSRWAVLVDSLNVSGSPLITPEFDNQTLAVLRGRLVRYLMRSREISFGRNTKDNNVDVDLSLEGPSIKVSRKQGTIKLRSNGDFFIANEGKHPIFVDGFPVLKDHKTRLHNNSVLEVAGLRFVFLINYDLINAIRIESAKLNMPIN